MSGGKLGSSISTRATIGMCQMTSIEVGTGVGPASKSVKIDPLMLPPGVKGTVTVENCASGTT